jgi:hypothetical protein
MGRMQREKGKSGEREAAKEWARLFGVAARRGKQFSGSEDSPDIVTSHAGLHFEVKRCEAGNPYNWLAQAIGECGEKVPVVLHRRNNQPWIAVLRLDDLPEFVREAAEKQQSPLSDPLPE